MQKHRITKIFILKEEAQLRLEDKIKFRRKQRLLKLRNKTTKPLNLNILQNPFQLILLISIIIYFLILLFSLFYDFEKENGIITEFNITTTGNKQQMHQLQHFFTQPIISSIISVLLIQIIFLFGIFIISKIFNPSKYLIDLNSEKLKKSTKRLFEYYIAQRGGVEVKISEKEILPGDLIKLKSGQRVPVDCRILHVLKEPFLVNQSCILQQQQNLGENNIIIELIAKTSPNHLNVLEARNIAFAGFKCLNGEAFCIVLRTREETLLSKLASKTSTKTTIKNISPPPYYLTSTTLTKENNNNKEEGYDKNKNKNKLKLLFGWPTVCIAALCSLIASLAFGYSLFLLLPSNDIDNNETNWYHNSIQLLIPFVCTFIALLISTLPYALPLTLLIRQWYSQRYLACNKEKNNPTEFRFIKKQQNKNCFLNGGGIMGNDCILIIHSNSLLGGNQPFLSDIWMASEKNNRHISTKTFPKYLDNQTIKFIKMGVSAILKNLPLEDNGINNCDYTQLKPEYSALLKYTKELGISLDECLNEENKIALIGPPEGIFGMCSFIKEENNENNNSDNENNFVDLREEHLMEFEEQFLRFCVQRKRCLALAVNSTPPPINENNNQNNLKNKNFCFVGLFAFEDAPLNIKYLNKLDKLIENGPKMIFIGDEHPALLIAKIMELNEKRPQKLINNNIFNNCPFIGNGTAKIENSENNMERGNNENNKENSFLHQLQNQLLRRLKNRKNVDFVSTSTTTSISTSTTLFNSKMNNKIINGNVKEKLEVFEEENIKWPIDGESFSQMSTKEIQQLLAEQFNSNKNNFVKNKFPLSFSKLSCEQITLIIKELQLIGHKVTFVGDVQNSINESQAIKQANLSIGIINYSNKLNNYSFNSFDALLKCLEDGSGLVKLIVGIKEYGVGMKINLIRSLSLTLSQAPALLLPFLLSPLSDIPPIILPIHIVLVAFLFQLQYCIEFAFTPFYSNNHHQHSLSTIYFNLILASPLLAFSSLFNYWNTLYSQNIYLEPNNDVKEFFSFFPINSTISSTILRQQLNLNEASTIWLFTLLFTQHLHILICIGFTNVFSGNVLKSLKLIILWICIFLFNILLLFLFIYLPGLRNFFQLTPPSSQNFCWWIVIVIVGVVFVLLNILFRFLLNNNAFKKSKFYKTILRWHNKQENI